MKQSIMIPAVLLFAACGGCGRSPDPALFVKPTIAVMKFENRAQFPMNWSLGDGMADILVDRLVATKRYHVIERPELGSILDELGLQHSGATRERARAKLGRIKNVEYLIKGTITDFGHVASEKGFFRGSGMSLFGSHARAVMGLTFYVVHVESGEIVASDRLQESVHASETAVAGRYKGVAMGGSVFYQTPLGKATAAVMDRAVAGITKSIASRRWQPKIAMIAEDGTVMLSGGANRKVQPGWQYDVLEPGVMIIDPDTGDPLGRRRARVIGRLQVVTVNARYCDAEVITGYVTTFKVGMACRYFVPVSQESRPGAKPKPKPEPEPEPDSTPKPKPKRTKRLRSSSPRS